MSVRCSVCGRLLDRPAAVLLGRGKRPTLTLCDECIHVDPRSMLAIDDDADTTPLAVVEATWMRRFFAPALAFAVAMLSRCWIVWMP